MVIPTPTIITIAAGILFLIGSVTLYKRENSYWSNGTRKMNRKEGEQHILNWRREIRQEFGITGGRRTKKHK
jgi:hypothetical protein